MDQLAMMSILIVTVAAPAVFARDHDPRRGLRRTLLFLFAFYALFVAYVTLVHTRYYSPQWWRL